MGNLSKWCMLSLLVMPGLQAQKAQPVQAALRAPTVQPAEPQAAAPAPTQAAPAQSRESLLIGPGDVLHVQVFDTPELEEHARVTDTGEIPLAIGVNVKVAAMTPGEAAKVIEQALIQGNFLLHPQVLVNIEQFATQNVSIIGEVRAPGAYVIATPRSILEVLALAGGLNELADRKILVERHGTAEKIPYFDSNVPGTAVDTAVTVYPGDTVIVPKAGILYVLGDVARPGGYAMTNNESEISALELVARSGGTTPTSVPAHAKLIRKSGTGYIEMALPLSDMQKGKRADLALQANDIIYVPFSYLRNFAVNGSGIAASAASAAVYRF